MTVQYTAISILFSLLTHPLFAQHEIQEQKVDSSSLLSMLRNGKTEGHFRYFFMATDNKKSLQMIMRMRLAVD